jgi:hypothetical protein
MNTTSYECIKDVQSQFVFSVGARNKTLLSSLVIAAIMLALRGGIVVLVRDVCALSAGHENGVKNLRTVVDLPVAAAGGLDEDVESTRNDQAGKSEDDRDVGSGETEDMEGIHSLLEEVRVGKRENNSEDWCRDEAKDGTPEERDVPILSVPNDNIEIAAQLFELLCLVSYCFGRERAPTRHSEAGRDGDIYCVEVEPPELGNEPILAKECRGDRVRCLG